MDKLKTEDFNLDFTLSCGQVFRWSKDKEGFWHGFINGRIVKLRQSGDYLFYKGEAASTDIIKYFNLNIDYRNILRSISKDHLIRKAMKKYHGLRIIKQDPFECLATYILSSQNNIPRINKMVNELSVKFGKKIECEGREYHQFPTIQDLAGTCSADYHSCRLGFRNRYLEDAIKKLSTGELMLDRIAKMPYQEAKTELLKVKGVGKKVADCVLLFAYNKYEAFPVDRWIERVMKKYYKGKEGSYFGKYAGYAQEFLYLFIRDSR
jgi:N-glycosylase/DNA lyase